MTGETVQRKRASKPRTRSHFELFAPAELPFMLQHTRKPTISPVGQLKLDLETLHQQAGTGAP